MYVCIIGSSVVCMYVCIIGSSVAHRTRPLDCEDGATDDFLVTVLVLLLSDDPSSAGKNSQRSLLSGFTQLTYAGADIWELLAAKEVVDW